MNSNDKKQTKENKPKRKYNKKLIIVTLLLAISIGANVNGTYQNRTTDAKLVNATTTFNNTVEEKNILIDELNAEIEEMTFHMEEYQTIVEQKDSAINELKEKLEELRQENDQLNSKVKSLSKQNTTTSRSSTSDRTSGNATTGEWIWGNISAYCSCSKCCGPYGGTTSSGAKPVANHTIAASSAYPFGTQIEIEGLGIFTVEDRGGAITGNKIDIYMNSHSECLQFGRQHLRMRVIT